MKTYQVEFKRVSYVTLTVEAESADHAEETAWQALARDGHHADINDAEWLTESISEFQTA